MLPTLTTASELSSVERLRVLIRVSQQLGALNASTEFCHSCPARSSQISQLANLQRELFETIASQLPNSPPPGAG